jgi:hypothetical protein
VSRLLRALSAAAIVALLTSCSGAGQGSADDAPSSVEAFPEPPHFDGPLDVALRPALPVVDDASCAPDAAAGRLCSANGAMAYRVLGESRDATVLEVSTEPSEDHTSWTAEIRFHPASRTAVGAARDSAAGLGGVVLLTVGDRVLMAVRPDQLKPAAARFFGLEKPEAWAIPEHFPGV